MGDIKKLAYLLDIFPLIITLVEILSVDDIIPDGGMIDSSESKIHIIFTQRDSHNNNLESPIIAWLPTKQNILKHTYQIKLNKNIIQNQKNQSKAQKMNNISKNKNINYKQQQKRRKLRSQVDVRTYLPLLISEVI